LNESSLKKLALSSGGAYFKFKDIKKFDKDFSESIKSKITKTLTIDLWDNPWVLGLILLLLSIEWIIRKQKGLL